MRRWLGCVLLLAVLLGGVEGCGNKADEIKKLDEPNAANRFPHKNRDKNKQ
jgi:hypothetical protein